MSAHWIRNPSSKQFKAVNGLVTERRWCLSGTPIQNCINDLVSLLRFLKFEPFSDMAVFRRYILEPLSKVYILDSANPLQMLLQGLCLRRTDMHLNVPGAHYEHIALSLHHDEQKLYDEVFQKCRRELDEIISSLTRINKKKSTLRFSMISALRRICNHGTLLEPLRTLTDMDIDAFCDYCSQAEEQNMAKMNGDSICPECHRSLSVSTPTFSNSPSQAAQPSLLEYKGASFHVGDMFTATLERSPLGLRSGLSTKLESVADNICRRSKKYNLF
jgi:SNF2 family DNA or RNA helicase